MTLRDALSAEFTNGEVRQFQGRGGQTFDYIEDETVMDRLDDALGVGNWSITVEPISVADGIVKVRLSGTTPDNAFVFEDFGYANNPNGDALKEAVSDGIRRCGRYLGVARYLYKKHPVTAQNGHQRPPAPVRAAPPPRSTTAVPDVEFPPNEWETPTPIRKGGAENGECPIHGVTWAGEWGDLWHKDPDGRYCRHPENTRTPARARK